MPQPSQHPNTPHPPAPTSPITITLSDIFLHNTPASKAITTTLQTHSEWIETDRATFSTTIYDLVRHWRLLWFLQDQPPSFHDHDITKANIQLSDVFFVMQRCTGNSAATKKHRL